jgi:hypothetical protein
MIVLEKAIYEILKNKAGGRVYALRAPQNATTPFIVYQRVSSERWRSINNPSGIGQATIQIDCYGSTIYSAKELAVDIENLLDGYSGNVTITGSSPQDVVVVGGVTLQNDVDIIDDTDEPMLYRNIARYLFTYETE